MMSFPVMKIKKESEKMKDQGREKQKSMHISKVTISKTYHLDITINCNFIGEKLKF
jgi:hypothetical protein